MNFKLTEEHEMIRKMVRDFAKNEVEPTAAKRDEEQRFDRAIFDKMADLGLTGIPWPEEYGGIGSDYLAYVLRWKNYPVWMRLLESCYLLILRLQDGQFISLELKNKNKNIYAQWLKGKKSVHMD